MHILKVFGISAWMLFTQCKLEEFQAGRRRQERQEQLLEQLAYSKKEQERTQQTLDSISNKLNVLNLVGHLNSIGNLSFLFEKCKESVFLIVSKEDEGVSQGSAFLVDSKGILLTNYHVLEGANEAVAIDIFNNKYPIYESNVISYNKEKDYLFFNILNPKVGPLNIANKKSIIGEECFAIGNPRGLTLTLSKGIVSGYRGENDELIQTSAEITFGSSGGPLFNTLGEVIGITSGGKGEANLNFAINIFNIPFPDQERLADLEADENISSVSHSLSKEEYIKHFINLINSTDYSKAYSLIANPSWQPYSKFTSEEGWGDIYDIRILSIEEKPNLLSKFGDEIIRMRYVGESKSKTIPRKYEYDFHLINRTDSWKITRMTYPIVSDQELDNEIKTPELTIQWFLKYLNEGKYSLAYLLCKNNPWGDYSRFSSIEEWGGVTEITLLRLEERLSTSPGEGVFYVKFSSNNPSNLGKEIKEFNLHLYRIEGIWRIVKSLDL